MASPSSSSSGVHGELRVLLVQLGRASSAMAASLGTL